MGGIRADRLWLAGGALGAVVLFLLGYFLVISPQRTQASSLRDQQVTAELSVTALSHKLAELRQQNGDLDQYKAQLGRDQKALPSAAATTDFLRELQAAGDAANVLVTGMVVGAPTATNAGGVQVVQLPITLTATALPARLAQFVDQVQRVQPRAILITTTNEVPTKDSASLSQLVDLTLTFQAFIAPAS
jgi:Tfp pilus assembly protein PilO